MHDEAAEPGATLGRERAHRERVAPTVPAIAVRFDVGQRVVLDRCQDRPAKRCVGVVKGYQVVQPEVGRRRTHLLVEFDPDGFGRRRRDYVAEEHASEEGVAW